MLVVTIVPTFQVLIPRSVRGRPGVRRRCSPVAWSMSPSREQGATAWTLDEDFKGLEAVRYFGRT
ncbi:hypothetical protein EBR04_00745 [bacterium]|nr:hypothetical protein [bacterium]